MVLSKPKRGSTVTQGREGQQPWGGRCISDSSTAYDKCKHLLSFRSDRRTTNNKTTRTTTEKKKEKKGKEKKTQKKKKEEFN